MPQLIYGTSPGALFCPVQDVTFTCIQIFPIALQWVLMAAETHIAARRGLPPPVSVIRRKSETYKYMNAILRDPLLQRSDQALHSVFAALVIESRITGPQAFRIHLQGLKRLFRARGGLASFLDSPLALMNMFLYM